MHPGLSKLKTTVRIPSSLKTARDFVAEQTVAEEKESAPQQVVATPLADMQDNPYTKEQFLAAWQQYAEQVKAAGRQGEYIILKEAPEIGNDHVVRVKITNSVQQDFFEKAKPAAQSFLRQTLQHSMITLDYIVVKEEERKRLYTAQEKLGYLMKKYPHLQVLKDKLGLEADF